MKTTPIQVDSHKGRFLTKDPDELHTLRLAIKRAVDPLPLDQMPPDMTREKVCQNALMTILSPKAPLPLFMDWKLPGGKIVRLITDQAAARGITADYPDPATHPNP